MKSSSSDNLHFLKLDIGEEVVGRVTSYINEMNITSGFMTAVGVVSDVEIGYYDMKKASYDVNVLGGEYELLSLNGNIGTMDGKVHPHIHVVLGDGGFKCIGGHLLKATVSVTCELFISASDLKLERIFDDVTNLKLLTPME